MRSVIRAVSGFFVGILIFTGLSLLGWGVSDINGFFSEPARLLYCVLIVVLSAITVLTVPDAGRSRGDGLKKVSRQHIVLIVLQILSMAIVVMAPYSDRRNLLVIEPSGYLRYAGLLLFMSGFLIMNWATAVLGKQFSTEVTIQENHVLITNGPFRYVRHPRYAGIILLFLGISFVFRSWPSVILTALFLLVILFRITDEEALLATEFRDDWKHYKKATRRLIPYIY